MVNYDMWTTGTVKPLVRAEFYHPNTRLLVSTAFQIESLIRILEESTGKRRKRRLRGKLRKLNQIYRSFRVSMHVDLRFAMDRFYLNTLDSRTADG